MSCCRHHSNVPFRIRSTYRGNGPTATKWWREKKQPESGRLKQWIMLECCMQDRGVEMVGDNIIGERGKVRNRSMQEDTRNGLIQTREKRKYEACRLWLDTIQGITSAEKQTRGLCLSVNVTVRQEIIPTPMKHQSRKHLCWLGKQEGAASALHVTGVTLQLSKKHTNKKKKKKPFHFHKSFTVWV